jgi:hypothetical protein
MVKILKELCYENLFIAVFTVIILATSINTIGQTILFEDDFEIGSEGDYNFVNWTHGPKPGGGWYPVINTNQFYTGDQCVGWTAVWETYMQSDPIDTSGADKIN